MNRRPPTPTTSHRLPAWVCAATLFFVSGVTGCVDVSGGAVELSWSLASSQGEAIGCDPAYLLDTASVRLSCAATMATMDPDPCIAPASRFPKWPCTSFGGSTHFEIPEGSYQFSIEVMCENGDKAVVRLPDPIVRDILIGEVAQLNALLIEVPTTPDAACKKL